MSKRYSGALITKTPVVPTSLSAPGIWSLSDQAAAQATNTWPFPRDPQFKNVTMLLHGDGSAGAVPATGVGAGVSTTVTNFNADASTNNFNVTINGDARSDNFNPYQAGYYSNYFDGTTDYLNTPSNAAFGMGTGDFTVETWIYFTAAQAEKHITDSNASSGLFLKTNATNIGIGRAMIGEDTMFNYSFSQNVWYHIAFARSGSTVYGFINGVQIGSATNTNSYATGACYVGAASDGSRSVNGYISNLRIVKGTAVYTSAFTPSTTPLTAITNTSLLTCQSNRFIDNSTNAFTITKSGDTAVSPAQPFTLPSSVATYGSGYFSGTTGGFLNAPANTAFNLGTGDFTVGGWVYPTSTSGTRPIVEIRTTGGANGFALLSQSGATTLNVYTNSGFVGASSNSLTTNAWNYVALTRSGNTWTYWINGVSGGSFTNSSTQSDGATTGPKIGGSTTSGEIWVGYLTDTFIVKGTALYSTTFTPPTSQLTAVSGTSLLTTQYNGGGNNSGFKDSSQFNFPITRNGNTTQGTFTPYGANWSNYLGGAGNYFQTPASSASTIVGTLSSTVNLTIECWIYPTAYNSSANFPGLIGDMVATSENNNWSWGLTNTGTLMLYWNVSGTQYRATSSAAVSLNTWTHIALNVASGSITMYANGVSQTLSGTTTLGTPSASNGYLVIGQWNNGSGGTGGTSNGLYTGYISNLRVVKASTYTSSFTPSTVPLTAITSTSLLYCQSNRFVDNSSNALAITTGGSPSVQRFSPFAPLTVYNPTTYGGSGYFDGSGDYLTIASNSQTGLQSNNFTMEFWVYLTNGGTNSLQCFYSNYTTFTNAGSIYFGKHTNNGGVVTVWFSNYSTGGPLLAESTQPPSNQWTHYALVRSSNTFSLYRNGALSTSSTAFTGAATGATNANWIFTNGDGTTLTPTGYLTDFRIVSGTAVYTAAFTPNTTPLTAVTNTALLTNYTNAGIFDNSMQNDLETVGNAQISTSVKKYGTGSMYFDGSGDRLYEPSNQNFNFGTGDFTIELWVYPISQGGHGSGNNDCLIDFRPAANGVYGTLYIFSSGTGIYWYVNSANRITGGAISNGVWTHIAICRSSGSTKLFLNGTQSGSTYTDANNYLVAPIMIGEFNDGAGAGNFNGYIDDLRISKVARYTANFTAPTAAFPNG